MIDRGSENKAIWWMSLTVLTYVISAGLTIGGVFPYYLFPSLVVILLMFFNTGFRLLGTVDFFDLWRIIILITVDVSIVNMLTGYFSLDLTMKLLLFVFISVALQGLIQNKESYVDIMKICVFAVSLSCIVAIFQSFGAEWAINIWEYKFSTDTYRSGEVEYMLLNGRGSGLSSYSLNLGFQIVQVFPIAFSILISNESDSQVKQKIIYGICTLLLIAGVLATGQRMALIMVIIQMLWILFSKHRITAGQLVGIGIAVLSGVFMISFYGESIPFLSNMISRMNRLSLSDSSYVSRIQSWGEIIDAWLEQNPLNWFFGCGYGSINSLRSGSTLGSGHNFIISNLVEYGFVGLILSLTFYSRLIRKLNSIRDRWSPVITCGLIGYLVVSLTNDSNLLDGDMFHIIILILIVGYATVWEESEQSTSCEIEQ